MAWGYKIISFEIKYLYTNLPVIQGGKQVQTSLAKS